MSEVIIPSIFSSKVNQQQNTIIESAINQLVEKLDKVAESRDRPFVFMKAADDTISGNLSANTILIRGTPVPRGFKGVVEDFNINFGTAAGTLRLIIIDPSGNKSNAILSDITSNTSGIGATVLDEGEALAIEVQTQGASTFGVYFSGKIQKVTG